jgi:iron complex transport system substrate-binding protein
MSRSRRLLSCVLTVYLAFACRDAPDEAAPPIVSLTPQGTRALHVLGVGDRIVAADAASRLLLPPDVVASTLSDVLDRRPDVVLVGPIAPEDESRVDALRRLGIPVVVVDPHQLEEALAL